MNIVVAMPAGLARAGLVKQLRARGHTVADVTAMAEAKAKLAAEPPPDVAVVDEAAAGSVPDLCDAVRMLIAAASNACLVIAAVRALSPVSTDLLAACGAAAVLASPPDAPDIENAAEKARRAAAAARDLPAIDREMLMEAAGQDAGECRDLLRLFLDVADRRDAELSAAIAEGRLDDARKAAHSWAGAAATCGLPALRAALSEAEDHAESGRRGPLAENLARVRSEMHRCRARMRAEWDV